MESNYLRNTSNNSISIKIYIKKRLVDDASINLCSILCKRKLVDAFGLEIYNEKERYGQDIPADFFTLNSGHGVYN
jgi:hypothetical protein